MRALAVIATTLAAVVAWLRWIGPVHFPGQRDQRTSGQWLRESWAWTSGEEEPTP